MHLAEILICVCVILMFLMVSVVFEYWGIEMNGNCPRCKSSRITKSKENLVCNECFLYRKD